MPNFEIEGYQFCDCCNTFVENDHYNSKERMCYGCIRDEIEEDEMYHEERVYKATYKDLE